MGGDRELSVLLADLKLAKSQLKVMPMKKMAYDNTLLSYNLKFLHDS